MVPAGVDCIMDAGMYFLALACIASCILFVRLGCRRLDTVAVDALVKLTERGCWHATAGGV